MNKDEFSKAAADLEEGCPFTLVFHRSNASQLMDILALVGAGLLELQGPYATEENRVLMLSFAETHAFGAPGTERVDLRLTNWFGLVRLQQVAYAIGEVIIPGR